MIIREPGASLWSCRRLATTSVGICASQPSANPGSAARPSLPPVWAVIELAVGRQRLMAPMMARALASWPPGTLDLRLGARWAAGWQDRLDHYGIALAILALPNHGLAGAMVSSGRFRLLYRDERFRVLIRDDGTHPALQSVSLTTTDIPERSKSRAVSQCR